MILIFNLGDYSKETTCKDKTGKFRKKGERWSEMDEDECNNCFCNCWDGRPSCACTMMACIVIPRVCKDKTGKIREEGERWSQPSEDGCNRCICGCSKGKVGCGGCTRKGCIPIPIQRKKE